METDEVVYCPECGHSQGDMGHGVACEECGEGPMPTASGTIEIEDEPVQTETVAEVNVGEIPETSAPVIAAQPEVKKAKKKKSVKKVTEISKAKKPKSRSKAPAVAVTPISTKGAKRGTPKKGAIDPVKAKITKKPIKDRAPVKIAKKKRAIEEANTPKVLRFTVRANPAFDYAPIEEAIHPLRAGTKLASIVTLIARKSGANKEEIMALTDPKDTLKATLNYVVRLTGYGCKSKDGENVHIVLPKGMKKIMAHIPKLDAEARKARRRIGYAG